MATTLRGINSRNCFIAKCQDLIRMRSSNVYSSIKCPSVQTLKKKKRPKCQSMNEWNCTLMYGGLPKQVIIEACSESRERVGL